MKNIFEKDLSGEMVSPNEPGYEALISDIFATIKTATEMNTGYRTSEEVREYMKQILGKPLEKSTTVLPPLYIDYGKPITIGKGCFIQQCCHWMHHRGDRRGPFGNGHKLRDVRRWGIRDLRRRRLSHRFRHVHRRRYRLQLVQGLLEDDPRAHRHRRGLSGGGAFRLCGLHARA